MTRLQRVLYRLGAWRFQRYRQWVGGCWIERYIAPTPHSSESPCFRWAPTVFVDGDGQAGWHTSCAVEHWPIAKLPPAYAREAPPSREARKGEP